MSSLELHQITKNYGGFIALKNIDLSVQAGEFIVMVGPSGCGKSTLLKAIAGLEGISSGKIAIGGKDVTTAEPNDRGIAMVFQSYALYPHMSVAENMGFGLRLAKRPKEEIEDAVQKAAKTLRLTDQLEKLPRHLSGGQRQRVAIGRAITRSPEVFLFDEPLSNLDAALRTQMRVELSTLHKELSSTMVYVTHDQVEAMTMADRIVVLNAGRIEQVGSPLELYINPANRFVAGFLGAPRMNFVEVKALGNSHGSAIVEAAGGLKIEVPLKTNASVREGAPLVLGIRPESLQLNPVEGQACFRAVVRLVEHLGRETIVYADAAPLLCTGSDTGTSNMTVQLPDIERMDLSTSVALGFDPSAAYLFDAEGQTLSEEKTN